MPQQSESFDVIIATYNRPQRVINLVSQINSCSLAPINIIVVDSSNNINAEVQSLPKVIYVQSSHKNQPYQRLLGAKVSKAKYIVYLDDDLKITDNQIFNYILTQYQSKSIVGVTVGIDYHNSVSNQLDSPIISSRHVFVKLLWKFTGVPFPAAGKIGRFGVPGPLPTDIGQIEYFYGPIMSFRKDIARLLIKDDLIAMYEKKIGKGEDKIISMNANLHGKLIIDPRICLHHPAVDSAYFDDIVSFYRKSIYSRLYLNKIYCEVFNKFKYPLNIDFYWFSLWRFFISTMSFFLSFSYDKRKKIKGILKGISLAMLQGQSAAMITREIDWSKEIENDCEQLNIHVQEWEN